MTPALQRALTAHQEKAVEQTKNAGRGLGRVSAQSRGELSTDLLRMVSDVSDMMVADNLNSSAIAKRIRQHSPLQTALNRSRTVLATQGAQVIRQGQLRFYARDMKDRGTLWQRNTAKYVNVNVSPPDGPEADMLWNLPLEGRTLEEWMNELADDTRNGLRGKIVKVLSREKGGIGSGIKRLAGEIDTSHATWLTNGKKVARMAALAALNASSKALTDAFTAVPVVTA